jgi:hypothetical protein
MGVDWNGNVIVTGYSYVSNVGNDYLTIKYDPNGDTVWVRRYNGPGNSGDVANALTLDSTGNVYVTGFSTGIDNYRDYTTIKYDPLGDTVWVRRFSDSDMRDLEATSISTDDSSNVYVAGRSFGVGIYNIVVKYNPDGDTIWTRKYQGYQIYGGFPTHPLAIDNDKNVFVTTYQTGEGTLEDFSTLGLNSEGDSIWSDNYSGPGNGSDFPFAIATDNNGNVYVTGVSFGDSGNLDYATIKYSKCMGIPGDANADSALAISDLVACARYVFSDSRWPACPSNSKICWLSGEFCRGDWNGDRVITLVDVIYGANHIFNKPGGPWIPISTGACCQ